MEDYTSKCLPLKYNTCTYYKMACVPYFYFKPNTPGCSTTFSNYSGNLSRIINSLPSNAVTHHRRSVQRYSPSPQPLLRLEGPVLSHDLLSLLVTDHADLLFGFAAETCQLYTTVFWAPVRLQGIPNMTSHPKIYYQSLNAYFSCTLAWLWSLSK